MFNALILYTFSVKFCIEHVPVCNYDSWRESKTIKETASEHFQAQNVSK